MTAQNLSEEACGIFENEFEDYYWVLTQNGILVREENSHLKRLKLVVDTTDKRTFDSVEWLAKTTNLSKISKNRQWQLNVFDADDVGFEDVIIFINGTFYCRDFFAAWKQARKEIHSFLKSGA